MSPAMLGRPRLLASLPPLPLLALSAAAVSLACGTAATHAVAEPQRAATAARPEPLVPYPVDNEADLARAIREYYTKFEVRIPMRDGTRLFTNYYVPRDRGRTWPILLTRTPYGLTPYGVDNMPRADEARLLRGFAPSPELVRLGYVFAHQDVRGRMMSEGTFVDVRPHRASERDIDETTDAYDTIDWLVRNVPSNDGKVGVWGISYPGFYAAQAAISGHPALRAASPQAPVTEWFLGDDFRHNGAFMLAQAFDFYESFGRPRPAPTKRARWEHEAERADAYDFYLALGSVANAAPQGMIPFWDELLAHPNRDAFWKARDPRPFYRDVKPAVLTVGGVYDAQDAFGALETYHSFERQSPGAHNFFVMGPWRHGGWARTDGDHLGDISFGAKTSAFYREKIEVPFFERYLRGMDSPAPPEAWIFETGTNVWRAWPSFPPPGARRDALYFHKSGALSSLPPAAAEDDAGRDSYPSDPAKPVPYRARPSEDIDEDYMSEDQRFAARRPDVLTYETGTLDADVTLAGPLTARLWVATTGSDADFVVKLVDVHPADSRDPEPNPKGIRMAGYQELVRGEVIRGRFRDGFESPKAFVPGEPALVRFAIPDVCHTFRAGHRLMVQVQSSWFPLVDRNPQTFVEVAKAAPGDFRAATHTVFRSKERPSSLEVTVAAGALPR
jgi:putative CocE/NonD family hydrolase